MGTKALEIITNWTQHPRVQIPSSVAHTEPANDNLGSCLTGKAFQEEKPVFYCNEPGYLLKHLKPTSFMSEYINEIGYLISATENCKT
jgi:hypothetical protein